MRYNPEAEREAYQRHLAEKDAERFYDTAESMNGQLEKAYEREANLHEQLETSLSREKVLREALEDVDVHLDGLSLIGIGNVLTEAYRKAHAQVHGKVRSALASTETEK